MTWPSPSISIHLYLVETLKTFAAYIHPEPVAKEAASRLGSVKQRTDSSAGRGKKGCEVCVCVCVLVHAHVSFPSSLSYLCVCSLHECVWWALRLRSRTHPSRNLSLLFCWPRKALTRCYEGVNFSAGCCRGHTRNMMMSLSITGWRAIRPRDTGEPSSLSHASDHYIDSPTGSGKPLQQRRP